MIKEQIIDVTRSYLVTDPEAFYENLMVPVREDSPEKMLPVVAFEGYNFLPTLYGYRSYFDTASKLDIGTLSSRCDRILLYQFANYQNILVALCEDGIWTNSGGSTAEAWNHRITLSAPGTGLYLEWTFCVIENTLYMYRQGNSVVYTITQTSYSLGNPVQSITPSFLNMTGQMGIFRANGRLGFWDSANSVSWSSLFSFTDFTPSLETLAGFATFNDVLGRIVTIKASGSGFIIYSTKNIVGVSYNDTGSVLFSAKTVAEIAGIWTSKQVCTGAVDTEQFAYTNTGIKHISQGFKIEDIFPGVYDFLKESREPVYLDFLNGRYLFLSLINPDYISGKVSFSIQYLNPAIIRLLDNGAEATDAERLPEDIEGIPFTDALETAIKSGLTEGLYAQWNASGSKLIPGRVSSMDPYALDDPFTPEDDFPYVTNTDLLYTTAELEAARDDGTWNNKVSVDNAKPSALDLGWHTAPSGTGKTDAGLERIITRQQKEWDEYVNLFTATADAIDAIMPSSYYWYDPVAYDSPPAPDLVWTDTDWVTLGYLPDPIDSATETAAFSGVGTYSASYEKKKTFTKARNVQRRLQEAHVDNVPGYGIRAFRYFAGGYGPFDLANNLFYSNMDEKVLPPPWTYDADADHSKFHLNTPYATKLALWSSWRSHYLALFSPPSVINSSYGSGLTYTLQSVNIPIDDTFGSSTPINANYLAEYIYKNTTFPDSSDFIHLYIEIATYTFYFQPPSEASDFILSFKKYSRLTSLRIQAAETFGGFESKLVASQRCIDWALYNADNPDPDFPYTTNEQDLGNLGDFDLGSAWLPNSLTVTYPGATFLLQNATTAPIYPDFSGAIVYDIFLQKWGKAKASYRCLMDYSPINSNVEQVVDYTNFGLTAGILTSGGFLKLFSANCTDSFIRYGKLAFSRLGYTYPEELVVNFRVPFTGSIQTDVSMDGRSLHEALTEETTFTGVGVAKVYPSYSGQWHTISVKGLFDIRSMSYTGRVSGIR